MFGGEGFGWEAVEIHGLGILHEGFVVGVEVIEGEGFDGEAVGCYGNGVGVEIIHILIEGKESKCHSIPMVQVILCIHQKIGVS